ncbi:nitrate reductase molybdenum cofactor assembly chaperone [Lutibaculum baratangense]|uniref:Respiratory nitrate reductase delta chain n=1 Tax=Lutibaculum baratangense AMV1 TaxID=631454 RepID=V4RKA5_9HYPH|nr:nitrate reductase molybdenum cofactor assembly chaperone [Lutibaculum baratangense]ESR25759.1 Respiratory nitrate reductase delta chain [Lutibaculum baratangense AMV1]
MAMTFKALSALLSYPTEDLQAALPRIREVLREEGLLGRRERRALEVLISELETADLYDAQERYCLLFDRSRSLSLHLFEHVHGESRDRGQAMVDLLRHYEEHGFRVTAKELPDFVPLFLEFLSLLPEAEARALLAEPAEILGGLEERLAKRRSPYAAVFKALASIARLPVSGGRRELAACGADEVAWADEADVAWVEDPQDLKALDAEWEETSVTFGPGEAGGDACSRDRLMTRLRAAARSVVQPRAE